jgi:hypothetical protein
VQHDGSRRRCLVARPCALIPERHFRADVSPRIHLTVGTKRLPRSVTEPDIRSIYYFMAA